MLNRLITNWVYGGTLAGVLLLLLTPTLARGWSAALTATFLLLPIYMLHQYEEHENDRFRLAINQLVAGGKEVLTPGAVFLINVPGVWGVVGASWVFAARFGVGWSLVAVYLVLVNALGHIAQAIKFRAYNPGVATASAVFLPFGLYTWWQVYQAGGGTFGYQLIGLGTALAIHAAILVLVYQRRKTIVQGHGSRARDGVLPA